MARRKTSPEPVHASAGLARRLKELREELFGIHGGPELARRLNLPARTWYDYESGKTVPAEVLLGFIEQTRTNPIYLFTGEGPHFQRASSEPSISELTPEELIRRGLEQLEVAARGVVVGPAGNAPPGYLSVPMFPLDRLGTGKLDGSASTGEVLAMRDWLKNPASTVAVRVSDEAMHPILPVGSIAAIDRSVTDPLSLQGKIVAARPDETSMIRWLDVSGRHLILRPNLPGRDWPLIPYELNRDGPSPIIGEVVFSWSRFRET